MFSKTIEDIVDNSIIKEDASFNELTQLVGKRKVHDDFPTFKSPYLVGYIRDKRNKAKKMAETSSISSDEEGEEEAKNPSQLTRDEGN